MFVLRSCTPKVPRSPLCIHKHIRLFSLFFLFYKDVKILRTLSCTVFITWPFVWGIFLSTVKTSLESHGRTSGSDPVTQLLLSPLP